jgi:hypothetical protein
MKKGAFAMPDLRPYVYLGMFIIILIMSYGCVPQDRVTIKQGSTEISVPRKDYDEAEAQSKKRWQGYDSKPVKHGVTLP